MNFYILSYGLDVPIKFSIQFHFISNFLLLSIGIKSFWLWSRNQLSRILIWFPSSNIKKNHRLLDWLIAIFQWQKTLNLIPHHYKYIWSKLKFPYVIRWYLLYANKEVVCVYLKLKNWKYYSNEHTYLHRYVIYIESLNCCEIETNIHIRINPKHILYRILHFKTWVPVFLLHPVK